MVGVELGQVQTVGTMEVVVLRNLWLPARSDFGAYHYPLRRMPLTMLRNRLVLLHRNLWLPHCEALRRWVIFLRIFTQFRGGNAVHNSSCVAP